MIGYRWKTKKNAGSTLVTSMITVLVLSGLLASYLGLVSGDYSQTRRSSESKRAFYAAEAYVEKVVSQILNDYSSMQIPDSARLSGLSGQSNWPSYEGLTFQAGGTGVSVGASGSEVIQEGKLKGLYELYTEYDVQAEVISDSNGARAAVQQTVRARFIGLFQFAAFYDEDLEFVPGPTVTMVGWVHSNKDLWLDKGGGTLYFDSYWIDENNHSLGKVYPRVTAAGCIYQGDKSGRKNGGGSVKIRDRQGEGGDWNDQYQNMKQPGVDDDGDESSDEDPRDGVDNDGDSVVDEDDAWLQHTNADWQATSQELWDGNVQDVAHGMFNLNLPLPELSEELEEEYGVNKEIILIEKGDAVDPDNSQELADYPELEEARFYWQADLRLLVEDDRFFDDGTEKYVTETEVKGYDGDGTAVISETKYYDDEGYRLDPANDYERIWSDRDDQEEGEEDDIWRRRTFNDGREWATMKSLERDECEDTYEKHNMVTVDVDVGNLIDTMDSDSDFCLKNGILYVHREGSPYGRYDGVRLVNAQTMPDGTQANGNVRGLTVATDNRLYVLGNYNTTAAGTSSQRPAAIAGDAISILSNSWTDEKSTDSLSNRRASNTTLYTAMMMGNYESSQNDYNGGLENLPRFLEYWSGKTAKIRGSMVDLWYSNEKIRDWYGNKTLVSKWSYGSYYTAPNRDWGYDKFFDDPLNWPPGTPMVVSVGATLWKRK
ncbi:MAG: hypothetical protein P9M00_08405 [Candidatus Tritonobacter lacicola]|nr:hypothetical protein [Candidatus Tritonobacter lacicola]